MMPASLRSALDSLGDGRSAIGPFRRFDGHERITVLREGERDGMRYVLFVHDPTPASETADNTSATIGCFSARDIDVTGFILEPATPPPSPIEKAFLVIAVAVFWIFKPLLAHSTAYPQVPLGARPRFTAIYSLRSLSPDRVRAIFTPSVLDFFESQPGWSVEGITGRLLVFRDEVHEPPERLDAFLAEAAAVAARFRG